MSDLQTLADSIVEHAGSGEQVEAYVTHQREFQVKAYQGEVESLSSAEPRGAGVRLILDGRVGFAYTTDLDPEGINEVVERARDNARHATPDEAVALAEPPSVPAEAVEGLYDPDHATVSPEDKVEFARALDAATRGHDPKVRAVEEAVYADTESQIAIASTTGIRGTDRRTDAWCYSIAIATDGDDTEVGFEFDLGRGLAALDGPSVARRAAERAIGVLGATKIPSESMPVVFDPYTAGQFLGVIGGALTAEAVQKGRSLFAGRIGDTVADTSLSLIDDGRVPGAPGSGPFDGEGIPTQRSEVIAAGVLTTFLFDTTTARRDGRASTGNASRSGFKSVPRPAPSNLAFDPTGPTRDQVLVQAGRALLVQDFHGVHSGANAITGDFSVGATGRLLENGVPTQAVKEVTIAAPMLDILARIVAVGDDRRWLPFGGSYGGATTLVSEMTVAGS